MLVIDIGNTNVVIALNDGQIWTKVTRIRSKDSDVLTQIREVVKNCREQDSVISSVVPNMTSRVIDIVRNVSEAEPLVISRKIKTGLDSASIPQECGSDIICNLIAAHKYFPDSVVTVADFGTAFTTATVNEKGQVLGVTIAPGMMTSVKALYENTAQIPQICLDVPDTVLGTDTVTAIRAGVFYGFSGQLEAIVRQIKKETSSEPKVLVTGGFSKYIKPFLGFDCTADIYLTLEGAKTACELNK